jgi:hypothetical protein
MTRRRRRGGSRRRRSRPVPKWLLKGEDLDRLARERCLMILSVLSGEKPVSDAIEEAKISRGRYYQLETRAVSAMLRALEPASSAETDPASPTKRITALEGKVRDLQQARRRAERLLLMTRRMMKGREKKTVSTRAGRSPSPSLGRRTALPPPSMREETGAGEP